MSTNYYATGHGGDDDPQFHVGRFSNGTFTWAMSRPRLETVLAGLAEKHCATCTCGDDDSPPAEKAVIEDEDGTTFTRMGFMSLLIDATSEDRSMTGEWFF